MSKNKKQSHSKLVGLIGFIPLLPFAVIVLIQSLLVEPLNTAAVLMALSYLALTLFPGFYLSVCIRGALKNPAEKQYLPLFVTTLLHILIFLFLGIFNQQYIYGILFGTITFATIFAIIIKRYRTNNKKQGK